MSEISPPPKELLTDDLVIVASRIDCPQKGTISVTLLPAGKYYSRQEGCIEVTDKDLRRLLLE